MNIALVAQDVKKELMVRFCIAYCGVLSRHKLCATASTGKLVSDATGLRVVKFLGGPQGGCQQILPEFLAEKLTCLSSLEMPFTLNLWENPKRIF